MNRLIPQTQREKELFQLGESNVISCRSDIAEFLTAHVLVENKLLRKELAKASLSIQPPTHDEQMLMHKLFVDRIAGKTVTGIPAQL